jgi:DNA-directed RNA polymerase specialized sigma24 family protein
MVQMSDPTVSTLSPFPSTHWTMVGRAGATDSQRRQVLGRLLERYLPAMRSYLVAHFGLDADQAGDLLQGFLVDKVLEQDVVRKADQSRGRFRNFLVRALNHFTIDKLREQKAAKRVPAGGSIPLDDDAVAAADRPAPATPDAFDVEWGRRVLELALDRMRRECDAAGRADLWTVFEARVLRPTLYGAEPRPLQEIVGELGVTPAQASNLLATSKRMFARTLREIVCEYAVDEQDADEEIRWLKTILSRSGT